MLRLWLANTNFGTPSQKAPWWPRVTCTSLRTPLQIRRFSRRQTTRLPSCPTATTVSCWCRGTRRLLSKSMPWAIGMATQVLGGLWQGSPMAPKTTPSFGSPLCLPATEVTGSPVQEPRWKTASGLSWPATIGPIWRCTRSTDAAQRSWVARTRMQRTTMRTPRKTMAPACLTTHATWMACWWKRAAFNSTLLP